MPRTLYFITHPNVVIDRKVPVTQWPLSQVGLNRMKVGLTQPWLSDISSIYCSTEQKAIDGAKIISDYLSINYTQVLSLGENDRSSTGFLPLNDFETAADIFFAKPEQSFRGWETAVEAQTRVVEAVKSIAVSDQSQGSIAIVSHGAVGTLLYCYLSCKPISRKWDQPANNGGNFYAFELNPNRVYSWWMAIDNTLPKH